MLSRHAARVAAGLGAAVVAASLSGCASYGVTGYPVTAYFTKAISLYKYSNVRVLGLPAGKVTGVDVIGDQVKVTMRIRNGINLPADVQAALMPQSLIGERYVQLFPAWVEGQTKAAPGTVIPVQRTQIPVEPDETLATLKKFFDSLDPHATGALISNLARDLSGNGQQLNDALAGLSQLSSTLADKDTQLGDLIDHFNQFASTLDTREAQLGKVMDAFATTTSFLVEERQNIEGLVHGLAVTSADGLTLIGKHQADLNGDLSAVTRILENLNSNIDNLQTLLKAGPELVSGPNLDGKLGLNAAYDPAGHDIDLRNSSGPLATALLGALGLPPVCTPVDTKPQCTPAASSGARAPRAGSAPPVTAPPSSLPAVHAPPVTVPGGGPIDGMMTFLSSPASSADAAGLAWTAGAPAAPAPPSSGGFLGWLRHAARDVVEALS